MRTTAIIIWALLLIVSGHAQPKPSAPAATASTALYEAKGQCGGPLKGWSLPKDHIPHLAVYLFVTQDKTGAIFWNDKQISRAEFADFLRRLRKEDPPAFTIFTPKEGVDCRAIIAMRHQLEEALKCSKSKGLCGEGGGFRYAP